MHLVAAVFVSQFGRVKVAAPVLRPDSDYGNPGPNESGPNSVYKQLWSEGLAGRNT